VIHLSSYCNFFFFFKKKKVKKEPAFDAKWPNEV